MVEKKNKRRRADVLLRAIHESTRLELSERGYSGVTFEGVAKRANTSKTVLYRRYKNRAAMVVESFIESISTEITTPSTGALRSDILIVLEILNQRIEAIGVSTMRSLLSEADDILFRKLTEFTWLTTETVMESILRNAKERGEISNTTLPRHVLLLPITLLRHELLFSGRSCTQETLSEIIDTVCIPMIMHYSRSAKLDT